MTSNCSATNTLANLVERWQGAPKNTARLAKKNMKQNVVHWIYNDVKQPVDVVSK